MLVSFRGGDPREQDSLNSREKIQHQDSIKFPSESRNKELIKDTIEISIKPEEKYAVKEGRKLSFELLKNPALQLTPDQQRYVDAYKKSLVDKLDSHINPKKTIAFNEALRKLKSAKPKI